MAGGADLASDGANGAAGRKDREGEPARPGLALLDAIRAHGPWFVGCVALAIRLVALAELSSAPSFDVPIVDEATYDQLARDLLAHHELDARYFWQGLFYPLFLAAVYALTGGSLLLARVIQALIGSISAALTCKLGRAAGGRTVGLVAGLLVALSGPLVFSDFELVATAWEVFWALSLMLVAMRARAAVGAAKGERWFALLGVVGGLAILTRASFVPFVAALAAWLGFALFGRAATGRRRSACACVFAAGLFAVLTPAAVAAREATGEARVLPYSGGINLYIGNNADSDATIQVRPGGEWDRLASLPEEHGAVTASAKEAFFLGLVVDFARKSPRGFVAGLGKKAMELVCAREIPRNIDVYAYRAYSNVLAVSTWRLGRFGFPFGVILPLALVGFALSGRALPVPVRILLVSYSLALVAVFVAARYRAPLLPPLAVAAVAGAAAWWRALLARRWRAIAGSSALAAAGAMAAWLPGPFPAEQGDYRAEMLTFVATAQLRRGRLDDAEPLLREALDRDPRSQVAHCVLGTVLTQRGDVEAAARQFEAALEIDPSDAKAHRGLGNLFLLEELPAKALPHLRAALEVEPRDGAVLNNVAQILHGMGDDAAAIVYFRRALSVDPTLDLARSNLAAILRDGTGGRQRDGAQEPDRTLSPRPIRAAP